MLTEQPRKDQRVAWRMTPGGPLTHHATVLRIEDSLCWVKPDEGDAAPFIWKFHDGTMNQLAEIVS